MIMIWLSNEFVQYVCVGIPADGDESEIKSNGTAYIGRH